MINIFYQLCFSGEPWLVQPLSPLPATTFHTHFLSRWPNTLFHIDIDAVKYKEYFLDSSYLTSRALNTKDPLFFLETFMSGKLKYSLVPVSLFPRSLEPLLDRALQFSPQPKLMKILLDAGNPLAPVQALSLQTSFTQWLHPQTWLHSPPCNADPSPDYPEVQISVVTCSSDSSTWTLRC